MSQEIVYALCERFNKCPSCYRDQEGSDCTGCNEYYCECNCKPLTKEQIIFGEE